MALLEKVKIVFPDSAGEGETTNSWRIPELLVTPEPLTVKCAREVWVIVKGLALGLKTMPFTSVVPEFEMLVVFEMSKVAVSDGPFGTVAGVQLAAVFQLPLVGLRFQVALSANRLTARARLKTIESLVFIGWASQLRLT